jgi:hypothetical protein
VAGNEPDLDDDAYGEILNWIEEATGLDHDVIVNRWSRSPKARSLATELVKSRGSAAEGAALIAGICWCVRKAYPGRN